MNFACEEMSMFDSAHSVTGLQQQKLLLPTLLVLVSSTPEELIGYSVHSAEGICEIGWMVILLNQNIEGIIQIVHLSAAVYWLRLEFEAYFVTR